MSIAIFFRIYFLLLLVLLGCYVHLKFNLSKCNQNWWLFWAISLWSNLLWPTWGVLSHWHMNMHCVHLGHYYLYKALLLLDCQDLCIIPGLTRTKSCWLIRFWFPLVTLHSCQGCIETYLIAIVLQLQILLNRARFKSSDKTTSLAISLPTMSVMQLHLW